MKKVNDFVVKHIGILILIYIALGIISMFIRVQVVRVIVAQPSCGISMEEIQKDIESGALEVVK